ncbi:hypothetical protein CISIN_1g021740mg [Citrus sinensis]|uniref:Pre-mRNA-splicing factor SYF2 n=1 Tax=Citrus sinensis TaxID=2711 RepID=A0A067FPM9_CITSI|nr:hypothetical protein CISIN_1g021740mg [Citrus sinensis]
MEERRVHPDCINASNPYHECVDYCFRKIAEAKVRMVEDEREAVQASGSSGQSNTLASDVAEDLHHENPKLEAGSDSDNDKPAEEDVEGDFTKLTGRQKKLFELRLKMNEARKANQTAMVAEKKRMEPPQESRGISKQKWLEERKRKIGKLLDANGLDMTKAFMLDTQEAAEAKYKKWEKDPAPFGWDGGSLRPISLCWSSFKLDHGSIQYSGQALELSRNVHACGYLSIEISR